MFGTRRRSSRNKARRTSATNAATSIPQFDNEDTTQQSSRALRQPHTHKHKPRSEARGCRKSTVKRSEAEALAEDRRELDAMITYGQCTNGRQPMFSKEVRRIMFAKGDSNRPLHSSCQLMEEILFEFMQNMLMDAQKVSKSNQIRTEDLCFVIRKDKQKLKRAKELLIAYREINEAKKIIPRS